MIASLIHVARASVERFFQAGGPLVSAATAFYVFLSAAPLTLVAVAIAGAVFSRQAARQELTARFAEYIGAEGAARVIGATANLGQQGGGLWATLAGLAVILLAASGLFSAAQDGLNQIWGVRPRSDRALRNVARSLVQKRLQSFAMVLICGGVLACLLAARAVWAALAPIVGWVPGGTSVLSWGIEPGLLLALVCSLLAWALRVLPDARVSWRDAWIGALVTAGLLAIGAFAAGLYARHIAVDSVYGAAGTVAVLMLWVYYCAQAFFLGASFTHVWAVERGSGVEPEDHAVRIVEQPE